MRNESAAAQPLRAVLAAVSVNLAGVLILFLSGAMAVQVGRDLGFGPAGVGLLSASYAGAALLGSAPLGGRVGRIGVQRSLRIASAVAAAALLLAALAPSTAVLAGAMVVGGGANAIGQPAGNATVAQHVPPARFGLAFAVKQSGIPLATLLAGLAVPGIALTIGWRFAYGIAAGFAVLALLLPPPDRAATGRRIEGPVPRDRRAPLWGLAGALALATIAATSIGAFGASGGVAIGLAEGTAGLVVAAGGLLGLTVRLLAGLRADVLSSGALKAVALLVLAGAAGWALMSGAYPLGAPTLFVVGLLVANAFGWGWPGLVHLAVARLFPTATAAGSGVTQTGVSLGLFAGPLLLGAIITEVGWPAAWLAATGSAIGAAVVTLLMRPRLRRQAGLA